MFPAQILGFASVFFQIFRSWVLQRKIMLIPNTRKWAVSFIKSRADKNYFLMKVLANYC